MEVWGNNDNKSLTTFKRASLMISSEYRGLSLAPALSSNLEMISSREPARAEASVTNAANTNITRSILHYYQEGYGDSLIYSHKYDKVYT